MEITVSIPDNFIPAYRSEDDLARQMLEAYAIENYRQEIISHGRFREILGLSVNEADALLKEHNVSSSYGYEDLKRDRSTIERLFNK